MASWQATNAKAKFIALLDAAEQDDPQRIHRRKLTFVVATEKEFERRVAEASVSPRSSSAHGTH